MKRLEDIRRVISKYPKGEGVAYPFGGINAKEVGFGGRNSWPVTPWALQVEYFMPCQLFTIELINNY